MLGRKDRSRSPVRVHRRDSGTAVNGGSVAGGDMTSTNNMMNPMMMANMYSQGGMMMPSGMYPNMMQMMSGMGTGMIPSTGMEMMSGTGMEMMSQASMDGSGLSGPSMTPSSTSSVDVNMMGMQPVTMMDPSMMAMYSNMTAEMPVQIEKKEIVLKYCKLTPPHPNAPQPPHRERPPGCRTIFVGGLPDKIRESTVREIFERFGKIHTLRLSKKNFCHIRFDRESCVDAAMNLSGYNIKLTGSKDKDDVDPDDDSHKTTGWLHVDFALSRDDTNEYERRQRKVLRAQQAQLAQLTAQQETVTRTSSYRRSPSPVRIQPFSNPAMIQLAEKIKSEEHFANSLPTLVTWLERGECSKKNSNQFYSMIQSTNTHIRRLFSEKMQQEEELVEFREKVKCNIETILEQLEQVAKVFGAATHQRVWDHFTKPQRKNIETWQKMTQEFHALKDEFNEKFNNEDFDYNGFNKPMDQGNEDIQRLKRENESLQFQLEAYKNEVDVIKADAQKEMEKFKAQFIARQALQGAMEKNPPLPTPMEKPPPPPPLPDDLDAKVMLKEAVDAGSGEAKLIGVMSAFLQVHPQGASLDYVVSYVRALFKEVTQATVHHVLQKHDDVFKRTTSGIGANIEHRWSFAAFPQNP